MTSVRLKPLLEWSNALLIKQGMYEADAEIVSRRLIEAELLGCTYGGLRWLPRLIAAMDVGDIDPRAQLVTVTDLSALAVLDGSTGVGQVAITKALQLGVEKAKTVGSATIVVKNSRPLGDPTACLAVATSAGCVAGILTACKYDLEPPVAPDSAWGWPTTDSPLVISSEPEDTGLSAVVLPTALCGMKPADVKKKLFRDDAEHVCFVIDPSKVRPLAEFHNVADDAGGQSVIKSPTWIFETAKWPETVELLQSDVIGDLQEFGAAVRAPVTWVVDEYFPPDPAVG